MSEKANFFTIGIFILVGSALIIGGLIVFGAGAFLKESVMMETYFDESVQGLDVGSPVKFRGVKIGEVEDVALVAETYGFMPDQPEYFKYGRYVAVNIALEPSIFANFSSRKETQDFLNQLVGNGLRLKLAYLGLTGLAYIEADYVDPEKNPQLEISWDPKNFYIPSTPNTIARLDASINDFMSTLESDLFPMLKNLNDASKSVPDLAYNVNTTLEVVNDLLVNKKDEIGEIIYNIRLTSKNVQELSSMAKKYPSQIIFGGAPKKSKYDR